MILVHCVAHKGIRFRWHSWGADIVVQGKRKLRWFEIRRRLVGEGVYQEYLLEAKGEAIEGMKTALVIAGHAHDDRNPAVRRELEAWALRCEQVGAIF